MEEQTPAIPGCGVFVVTAGTRDALPHKPEAVLADSKANRQCLQEQGIEDCIQHKASRGKPLHRLYKEINKGTGKLRCKIEQGFGTMKRQLGLSRAREPLHNPISITLPTSKSKLTGFFCSYFVQTGQKKRFFSVIEWFSALFPLYLPDSRCYIDFLARKAGNLALLVRLCP